MSLTTWFRRQLSLARQAEQMELELAWLTLRLRHRKARRAA